MTYLVVVYVEYNCASTAYPTTSDSDCSTGKMLADFFTKPLQGQLFNFFRRIIMGWDSIYDIISLNDEMKERVEKWKKYNLRLISSMENNERDKGAKDEDVKKKKERIIPVHEQTRTGVEKEKKIEKNADGQVNMSKSQYVRRVSTNDKKAISWRDACFKNLV